MLVVNQVCSHQTNTRFDRHADIAFADCSGWEIRWPSSSTPLLLLYAGAMTGLKGLKEGAISGILHSIRAVKMPGLPRCAYVLGPGATLLQPGVVSGNHSQVIILIILK